MTSTYFKNMVVDNLFHTAAAKPLPGKYYIGWSTTVPAADGTNFTEPTAVTGYARVEMTGMDNAVAGMVDNGVKLAFAESTAAQGIAVAYGIFDALTGGNLLIYKEFATADKKTVDSGTTMFIKPGEAKFTLSDL